MTELHDPADAGERLLRSRLAFSPAEAALVCGISRDAIDDAIRRGQLVSIKVGARVVIGRRQLEAWLAGGDSAA